MQFLTMITTWSAILFFCQVGEAQQDESLSAKLKKQTPEEILQAKLGQLLMVGFSDSSPSAELTHLLRSQKASNFILFRRNIQSQGQSLELNNFITENVESLTGLRPFIAVDQEGGDVIRIQTTPSMPSAFFVGQLASPKHAWKLGRTTGALLKSFGVNMNLAPVLDISSQRRLEFLRSRSFGTDPINVGRMGYYFSVGLKSENVLPVAKHFPSIGETSVDPHREGAHDVRTLLEIKNQDLKPYTGFFKLGNLSGVLLSHTVFEVFDKNLPASRSAPVYNLLRNEMNFKGLAITDDLLMAANGTRDHLGDYCVQSIEAGADIILLSANGRALSECYSALHTKALKDPSFFELVANRFDRIAKIKKLSIGGGFRRPAEDLSFDSTVSEMRSTYFTQLMTKLRPVVQREKMNNQNCLQRDLASFLKELEIPSALATSTWMKTYTARKFPAIHDIHSVRSCALDFKYAGSPQALKRFLKLPAKSKKRMVVFASHAFTPEDEKDFLLLSYLPRKLYSPPQFQALPKKARTN